MRYLTALVTTLFLLGLLLLLGGCPSQQRDTGGQVGSPAGAGAQGPTAAAGPTVAMIPKIEGIDYFNACQRGAEEAAKELGVNLLYSGPTENRVERQNEIIDGFIAQGVDVVAVSPNDPVAIAPVLRKAREAGIKVLTWDADAESDARDFFVDQCTPESVGYALVDEMAAQAGPDAKTAIVTGSLTAANQNEWIKWMDKRRQDKYPKMTVVATKPSEEDQQLAFQATQDVLKAHGDLDGIFAITSVAFPGAADAVEQAGKSGKVALVGLSTPKGMRPWVDSGTVKTVILWNPVDLGYLTIAAAQALVTGDLKPGVTELAAGRLGTVQVKAFEVILGEPARFTRDNIADYDF